MPNSLQQKVRTNMAIPGFLLSIFVAASGTYLLATAQDDGLARITGMALIILGSMLAGYYYAMLMGW